MTLFHLGPAGDTFAGAFGVSAAVVLIGGPMLLRWQRNRQQFALVRLALERGITQFPSGPAYWLASLRLALSILTLGIGLMLVGAAAAWWTNDVGSSLGSAPEVSATTSVTSAPLPPAIENTGPRPGRPAPPPPNPALEEWHRKQAINTLGLMSLACGFVLTLLGVVRALFARVERHQFAEESKRDSTSVETPSH